MHLERVVIESDKIKGSKYRLRHSEPVLFVHCHIQRIELTRQANKKLRDKIATKHLYRIVTI